MAYTYSFLDVQAAIDSPSGGRIDLANKGIAEEGITIAMNGDKGTMIIGADGTPMHSLHADKSGKVTIRTLATSVLNKLLTDYYQNTTGSAAAYGNDTISVRDPVLLKSFTCQACALAKFPDHSMAKEGGVQEWIFNCGYIDQQFGALA